MTISGNALLSAVMLAIFCVMLMMAGGYPPEARLMPLLVGLAGASLSLVQLWQSLFSERRKDRPARTRIDAAIRGIRLLVAELNL